MQMVDNKQRRARCFGGQSAAPTALVWGGRRVSLLGVTLAWLSSAKRRSPRGRQPVIIRISAVSVPQLG